MTSQKPLLNIIVLDERWKNLVPSWQEDIPCAFEKAVTLLGKDFSQKEVSIVLMDDIESNLNYILQEQNEKNITLCVHPYIDAFIKKGVVSLQWKWFFKFNKWVKVKAIASYYLTEFHFLNSKEEEIKL